MHVRTPVRVCVCADGPRALCSPFASPMPTWTDRTKLILTKQESGVVTIRHPLKGAATEEAEESNEDEGGDGKEEEKEGGAGKKKILSFHGHRCERPSPFCHGAPDLPCSAALVRPIHRSPSFISHNTQS